MLSAREIIGLQAEKHELVVTENFESVEAYCLHLIHTKAYREAAKQAGNKDVLDLGCNVGYGTGIVSEVARRVSGVDVSPSAIDHARRSVTAGNVSFDVVDGRHLPFGDASFDLVTSFQVVEHIAGYGDYFSEIARVLRPGGAVIFTTPNAAIRLDPGMKPWNPFHVREFRADEFGMLLRNWFPDVAVRGLFAEDAFYEIEFNRASAGRLAARRRERAIMPPATEIRARVIDTIKAALPGPLVRMIRESLRSAQPDPAGNPAGNPAGKTTGGTSESSVDAADLRRFTLDQLFYRDTDLDTALDLMAVCRTAP